MLTVRGIPQLQAAAVLFRQADKATRAAIRSEAKTWAPTLRDAAMRNARSPQQQAVAASGRTTITTKGLRATFGAAGSIGNAKLGEIARPYEFGTGRRGARTEYLSRQRTSGRAMKVRRRTKVQLPTRDRDGLFLHPAVAQTTPDLVGRYVRAIAAAVERG